MVRMATSLAILLAVIQQTVGNQLVFIYDINNSSIGQQEASEEAATDMPMSGYGSRSTLKTYCNNVEKEEKVVIGTSDTTLQDACELQAEIETREADTLTLSFAVSQLTGLMTSDSMEGNYLNVPKLFSLVDGIAEKFTEEDLSSPRSVTPESIPLEGLRNHLDGRCGTVYLVGTLKSDSEPLDRKVIPLTIECPDETGVDLLPMVEKYDSSMLDYDQALNIKCDTSTISVSISVKNNGTAALAPRTDPDALRVWVYLRQTYHHANATVIRFNASGLKEMPKPGDFPVSIGNVIQRTMSGSPGIEANSSVELTLTQLEIPKHMYGDALLVIIVDPLGEISSDKMRNNNAMAIRVRRHCQMENNGRCNMYGTKEPGASWVSLHHSYSEMPSALIKLYGNGEIEKKEPYMMKDDEHADVIKAVALSYAIEAEVKRLQDIGSCDFPEGMMEKVHSWDSSVLGQLAQSLVDARQPLGTIETTSKSESEKLEFLATILSAVGQLLQQEGSIRTIISTLIHNNSPMMDGDMGGYPEGSGGYGGGGHHPYSGGYRGGGHHPYSGGYRKGGGMGSHHEGSGEYGGSGHHGRQPYTTDSYGDDDTANFGGYNAFIDPKDLGTGDELMWHEPETAASKETPNWQNHHGKGEDIVLDPKDFGTGDEPMLHEPETAAWKETPNWQNHHGKGEERPWNSGMGGIHHKGPGGDMMNKVQRVQMFFGMLISHIMSTDHRDLRLPGCFPGELDNFRRFVKALIWKRPPIHKIPGYEKVSEDFISNAWRLVELFTSGKRPAIFGELPYEFGEGMEQWDMRHGGFNPVMPMPDDLVESALQAVVDIANNFTVHSWERDAERKRQNMVLFGKVARALLNNNREEVLDKFQKALVKGHALLASGEMAEVSGMPGKKLSNDDICKRIVEGRMKKDADFMDKPMLYMENGDIYSARRSPMTNELITKMVVACQCNNGYH